MTNLRLRDQLLGHGGRRHERARLQHAMITTSTRCAKHQSESKIDGDLILEQNLFWRRLVKPSNKQSAYI